MHTREPAPEEIHSEKGSSKLRVLIQAGKDVIFPGLFEFSGIGKSREIVTISREFSGTGFMQNNPKYQPKFNIFKIILSTFNVMDIID